MTIKSKDPATSWIERISPILRICGMAQSLSGWVEPLRVIYEHELVIFEEGDFVVEISSRQHACHKGSFIIIPPGLWHTTRMLSPSGKRRWVHFDWEYRSDKTKRPISTYWPGTPRPELYRQAPDWAPPPVILGRIAESSWINDMHDRLGELWNHGTMRDGFLCRGLLMQLLVALLVEDSPTHKAVPQAARLAEKDRRLLNELTNGEDDPTRSIQTAFRKLGFSYAHVCRTFRQFYGTKPIGYLNSLRLERARTLIHDTQLTMAEIAIRVGYESPAYFARIFKRNTGKTPSQYRSERNKVPAGKG